MKRPQFAFVLLFLAIIFSGCSQKINNYTISTNNTSPLIALSKNSNGIKLGSFSDSGKDQVEVMCRTIPIVTPNGDTYVSYIKDALKKELIAGGMYNSDSQITIKMNLDDIYSSTMFGDSHWKFKVTIKSSNGISYQIESKYDYESSFLGNNARERMIKAFVPAVQKLNNAIISNPKFASLLLSNDNNTKSDIDRSGSFKYEKLKLDFASPIIGYAYMENGDKLISVSKKLKKPTDDDIEVIVIRENGFSPNYYVTTARRNGSVGFGSAIGCSSIDRINKENGNVEICASNYTSQTALGTLLTAAAWMNGDISGYMKVFDKKYFLEVVEKNKLIKEQEKLLSENK